VAAIARPTVPPAHHRRLRADEKTKAYVARRIAEGHSKRDPIRALKRYIAREAHGIIMRRQKAINQTRSAP
jgi:hypothetical protein